MFQFLKSTYNKCVVKNDKRSCGPLSRRKGVMSDRFKEEIAKELGIYDTVQREGWGGIKSRDAGNMVKRAVEMAQEQMEKGQR